MSKLSDEMTEIYDGITQNEVKEGMEVRAFGSNENGIETTPGFLGAKSHYEARVNAEIRKAYRYHAGADLEPTGQKQLEAYMPELLGRITPVMLSAFTDGVLVGEKKIHPVKKAFHAEEVDSVFESKAFRKDSDLFAVGLRADEDAFKMIQDHLQRTVEHMGEGSNYVNHTGAEVNKIWDLWVLASLSTMFSFYIVGMKLGTKWAEADTLAFIEKEING